MAVVPMLESRSADEGETLAERAARLIHAAIVSGDLAPGTRLKLPDLARGLSIGVTPLREGLSRMVAGGLVRATGQRGFQVAPMSRSDLEDLMELRTLIETQALRLSIERGDDVWEGQIVAALHRLRRIDGLQVDDEAQLSRFEQVHRDFHAALISACASDRIIAMQDHLYDQARRYRRVLLRGGEFVPEDSLAEHSGLAAAAIARDVPQACALMREHFSLMAGHFYRALEDGAGASAKNA